MRNILRVREYDRINCGRSFDAASASLSPGQFSALEAFADRCKRQGLAPFGHGPRRTLVAQNLVGLVDVAGFQVEILPKIHSDASQSRHNLVRMLAEVLAVELHALRPSKVGEADSLLEALARSFCSDLWNALRAGMVRQYERIEENLTTMRGKLDVTAQMRHNSSRLERLYCRLDEFTADVPLNRALKAAMRVLERTVRSPDTTRRLRELLFAFQDVRDLAPSAIDWDRIQVDRLSVRYRPLLALAKIFVRGRAPDVAAGQGAGFAMLFDMNELFEEYVGRHVERLARRHGLRAVLQGPRKVLAASATGRGTFGLRPDIVICDHERPTLVVDTKWKRLREDATHSGVSSADLYQVYAYVQRYDCEKVMLLYPHHHRLRKWSAQRELYEFQHNDAGLPRRHVSVATLDLSDLDTVPQQLSQLLFGTAGSAGSRAELA